MNSLKRLFKGIKLCLMDCFNTNLLILKENGKTLKINDFLKIKEKMALEKAIGTEVERIVENMIEQGYVVPAQLVELYQYLRFKGNSERENEIYRFWQNEKGDKIIW